MVSIRKSASCWHPMFMLVHGIGTSKIFYAPGAPEPRNQLKSPACVTPAMPLTKPSACASLTSESQRRGSPVATNDNIGRGGPSAEPSNLPLALKPNYSAFALYKTFTQKTCTYIHVHIHTHTHVHIYIYTCKQIRICIYAHAYLQT